MLLKQKLTILKWFDIFILTVILFGEGIINSTMQYLALQNQARTLEQNLTFTTWDNYKAIMIQLCWLFLALLYLKWRNFDFGTWKRRILLTKWLPLQVLGIFTLTALCMDSYHYILYYATNWITPSMHELSPHIDLSLILYSLLNGFYEEIFFLGMCLMVTPKFTKWAFLYSLIIRCSFHTYQGLGSAIGLGLIVGIIYYLIYRKMKRPNMLPFFLAHAIADVMGLTILSYLLY
nr:CPBP family intramembrane glutamic endopeptidase [Streptococcus dysgalactiae]